MTAKRKSAKMPLVFSKSIFTLSIFIIAYKWVCVYVHIDSCWIRFLVILQVKNDIKKEKEPSPMRMFALEMALF